MVTDKKELLWKLQVPSKVSATCVLGASGTIKPNFSKYTLEPQLEPPSPQTRNPNSQPEKPQLETFNPLKAKKEPRPPP